MRKVMLAVLALAITSCDSQSPSYDLLIVNGLVYDGTGAPAQQRNVLIDDGRIVSVDASESASAAGVINAAGKLVMPGFIDPHTHAPLEAEAVRDSSHVNYLTQGITTVVVGNDGGGVPDRVDTFAQLEPIGTGTNIAFFAGHNAIRKAVMGYDDRAPTDAERDTMQSLLREEMDAGALGLSSGLYYAPGSYSETDELVELARIAASYGGIYDTHLRDESTYSVGLLAAIDEAIAIGEQAGIAVHISHIKALGRDVWGQSHDVIQRIEDARSAGIDVTANQYPWQASGVMLSSALVPRWAMAGSVEEMHARLRDPALKERIREEMEQNLVRRGGPQAILVVTLDSAHRGQRLNEISDDRGTDAIDTAIDLVINEDPKIASFVMNQDDIEAFRVQPWVMTGSDGGTGHPRYFASYPKAWQDFVVKRKLLTAEQFVHRSSGMVADTLGLCDRGYLKEGYAADLIIVDPDTFLPHATYEWPEEFSTGVEFLLLRGIPVIADGRFQGLRKGEVLTRNRQNCDQQQSSN